MYRLFQKHGKKLLAVFSAFLMISFAASGMLTGSRGRANNPVIGHIGKEKLYGQELFMARQDWQTLSHFNDGRGRRLSALLGPQIEAEITRQPILFLLLQKEAEQLGVNVSQDSLQTMLTNTPGLITTDPDRNEVIARAVKNLLLVVNGAQRAASVIKVTDPMVQHQLAQVQQSITLNLVDFTTAKYLDQAKATPLTAEEIKTHFEKYADTIPGDISDANPFGFGYKYPDRVKIQYIVVPKLDVRRAVEASKSPYEWEVDARKYYLQNKSRFKADPTTQPKAAFDLGAPSTQATTKPYDQVQQEIKDQLVNAETDRRLAAIRDRIVSTLGADWVAYRNTVGANATTQTSTAPTTGVAAAAVPPTSQGVPYATFEYLQKLAQQIQANKTFGVLPTAVSIADKWLGAEDLSKVPGVGQAQINNVPITSYIMTMTAPFVPEAQRKESGGWLRLMEPTRPMEDQNGSVYIVRVTAAEPTHRPATIAEVEQQVRADLLTARSYALARADATKLLEQARQQGDLKAAAAGKQIVTAGPITMREGQVIPSLALTGAGAERFVNHAFKLLATTRPASSAAPAVAPSATTAPAMAATAASTQPGGSLAMKPIDLIELPRDGRVLVGQLSDVQAMWTERSVPMEEAQIHRAINMSLMQRFIQSWFDYDAVVARTHFVPEANAADELKGPSAPAPAAPPIL